METEKFDHLPEKTILDDPSAILDEAAYCYQIYIKHMLLYCQILTHDINKNLLVNQ